MSNIEWLILSPLASSTTPAVTGARSAVRRDGRQASSASTEPIHIKYRETLAASTRALAAMQQHQLANVSQHCSGRRKGSLQAGRKSLGGALRRFRGCVRHPFGRCWPRGGTARPRGSALAQPDAAGLPRRPDAIKQRFLHRGLNSAAEVTKAKNFSIPRSGKGVNEEAVL